MIYKLGILGLGEGRSTMSAALKSDKWELRTICDRNEDLCRQRAKEFGFHHYVTDYRQMLDDPDIDVIGIYTPDHLHAEHIKMALLHGKHVVCTKPLLNDLSAARELTELQQKTGNKIFVGQSSRFFEPMMRQRADFENGRIGSLVTVEAQYNADHRWFLGKGWSLEESFSWLFGGLSHPVDLVRWYLPELDEVMGYGMLSPNGAAGGLKQEDTMHFIFKTADGRIARVSGSYSGPVQPAVRESEMTCILRGTEGCSQADYMDLRYAIRDKAGEERLITFDDRQKHYFRFEGKSHHAGEYQNYLEYFADCLTTGKTAYPDLQEGIGTIAVLKAMQQSLKTGQPVKIGDLLADLPA
ncbi:MAG: Gfo/Idh/MocA family protein [Mangrovibacterium sp.]